MDDENILNNINDNSIIKYIKKVYPKIIYEKINIKNNDRDILGFIIKDKQLIIGFIDKDGILNKIMDPIKLSTSNENLENIFKKIPIVESFTEQDKENLIKMIENNDSDIFLKEVILKKDKLIKELENKNNNYNVLFDENKKEMLIYKKEYEDKVKEIKKEYDEKIAVEISNYTKNINNCKDKLINEKKEIINAIIEYKKNIENHIKNILNNNIGIEEIKKIKESYNKLLKEKNEIERNLEIILKSEEKNKALVEDELKRKELEYKLEIEKEKEKYNQEKEENERKYREEIEKIKKECIDSKDSILKETLTKTQNEYIVEIENLKDECKKRLLEKENIHIENVKKIKDEENMSKEMIKLELKEMERKYQEELKKEKELYKQDLDKREKEFIIKIDEMKKVYEQGEKSINEKNYIEEIDKIKNLFLQKENNIKETLLKKENEYIKEKERIKAEYDEIIIKKEEEYKEGHIKDLEIKENKIKELEKVINTIKEELSTIEKKFSKTEVERLYFENFNKKCIEKILNEKEIIIQNIKRYREEWIDWIKNNNIDIDKNKIKLKNELDIIFNTLKKIKMERDVYINNLNISSKEKSQIIAKLQNNMEEMKIELKKTLSDQIIKLTKINEELTIKLREKDIELNRKNDEINKYKLELEEVKKYIDKNQESVTKCNKELQIVKEMLDKNILQLKNKQTSKVDYNYNECEIILNNFININNIFYRKLEIIKILDGIINYNGINSFTNLNENIKQKIIQKFNKTKSEILNYINNMKLHKYIETPYLNYFKNKNMINKIPIEFCEDLKELLNYWLKEEENFRINDIDLTNIYEDLSGSVRVYVRIKPLIGEKNKTVFVDKNKVTIDCSEVMLNRKETFGDFYGVFDDMYTNKDIYRGYIETGLIDQYNLIVDIDKNVKSNGLYNVFQQVENGYSIVIFGYGLSGSGKCLGKNTPILMYDGNIKMVQDIKDGDLVMGDDSKPRRVFGVTRGRDTMYEIKNTKGESYIVNSEHIISLKYGQKKQLRDRIDRSSYHVIWFNKVNICFNSKTFSYKNKNKDIVYMEASKFYNNIQDDLYIDIPIQKYLSLSSNFKDFLKGYKVPVIFPYKEVEIDPYMIGYWIGDGNSNTCCITSQESPVLKYFNDNLSKYNCYLSFMKSTEYIYRINSTKNKNYFMTILRKYNLLNNKHIPIVYKCNSREQQLKLLAGILDADGHYRKGMFELTKSLKHEQIIDDVIYLCRSLGFACYKKTKNASWSHNGIKKNNIALRICISGEGIEEIPTLSRRKQASPRRQIKDVLVSGISVRKLSNDEYFGFAVDGNHRFMLGDFTVTHNTFTLIGQNNIPGILHYGLANLRNIKTVKLKYLFEQYIDTSNIGFVPTINKIRGNIINLINEIPQLRKYNINENAEFLNDFPKDVNINNLKIIDLNKITNYLEKYRISKKRIKVTPNNPVSSRSHLYMIYEILFENGIIGYITIVDTAGRESPINIYDEYIDKSKKISLTTILGPTGGTKVLEKAIKEEYKNYDINNVYNTLKEGFYINETINHLIYYFNKKNYKSTKIIKQINLDKYSTDKYYVSPIEEENSINDSNNCLMIPILKFLDVLSNKKKDEEDYKPTKFITIVCVRKDEKYCDQIFSSLEFAQKIRSS